MRDSCPCGRSVEYRGRPWVECECGRIHRPEPAMSSVDELKRKQACTHHWDALMPRTHVLGCIPVRAVCSRCGAYKGDP